MSGGGEPRGDVWAAPWTKAGWKLAKPEDRCTEQGCTKTVREHIEEFRAIGAKPNTLLSRPSQREQPKHEVNEEVIEGRRVVLLEQARQLREQQ